MERIPKIDIDVFLDDDKNSIFISFVKDDHIDKLNLRTFFLFLQDEKVINVNSLTKLLYKGEDFFDYLVKAHNSINKIISNYESRNNIKLPIIVIKKFFKNASIGKNDITQNNIIHIPFDYLIDINKLKFSLGHELGHTLLDVHHPNTSLLLENKYMKSFWKELDKLDSLFLRVGFDKQYYLFLIFDIVICMSYIWFCKSIMLINIEIILFHCLLCFIIFCHNLLTFLNHKKEYFCDFMSCFLNDFDIKYSESLMFSEHSEPESSLSHLSHQKRLKKIKNYLKN